MDPALTDFPALWTICDTTGEFVVRIQVVGPLPTSIVGAMGYRRFLRGTRRGAWRRSLPRRRVLWRSAAKGWHVMPSPVAQSTDGSAPRTAAQQDIVERQTPPRCWIKARGNVRHGRFR
jgi:hypothetical protein